jgi:aminocarboxymuconate-semialdehyde decarboxylase
LADVENAEHRTPAIDVHTHVVLAGIGVVDDPHWPVLHLSEERSYLQLSTGRQRNVSAEAVDMAARALAMDLIGVDVQVLSPIPAQLADTVGDPHVATSVSRAVNEALAGYRDTDPKRFEALGTLPVADEAAIRGEIAYARGSLGLRGFEISSEGFFRMVDAGTWASTHRALDEAGAILLIHPQDDALARRRGVSGRLAIGGVSMTTETALVAVEMMRLDTVGTADLSVVLAHGGGALPYMLARLDRLWEHTDARSELRAAPSEVFREAFFVDTCVHDPGALAVVAHKTRPDRLLFGSDYPFPIGVSPSLIEEAGLKAPDVLWHNARALGL